MKRAIFILVLSSSALFAQVRGVPASVTSYNGNRSMAPGVPASVTSLGPHGYSPGLCLGVLGCTDPNFRPTINFQTGTVQMGQQIHTRPGRTGHRGRGGHGGYGGYGGYVYSYGYPYPVFVPVQPVEEGSAEEQQAEPPAPTVFERRPEARPAPNPTPAVEEPTEQPVGVPHHNMSPVDEEATPVVLVFKDGHEQEIGNYAIVGDTLYDLSGKLAHKVKLSELDLSATVQKNEERGVEFNVPLSQRGQG